MNHKFIVLIMMLLCAVKVEAAADTQRDLDEKLFGAVERCDAVKVEQLIEFGANVNACDRGSARGVLYRAAQTGFLPVVNLLLQKGAQVNAVCSGGTALHAAVKKSKNPAQAPAIVARLFDAGADINITDSLEETPLLVIQLAGTNSLEDKYALRVALQFLVAGVDRSAIDSFGNTAAEWARQMNRPALAELIEGYPGRNLQERIICIFAKNYFNVDALEQKNIERDIKLVSSDCYVDRFYILIGKERSADSLVGL